MVETLNTVTWKEFQKRKERNRIDVLDKAALRVERGRPSHIALDLDMLPIINRWDKIPFSYTVSSCSGTPIEHDRGGYGPVNGQPGGPHAMLYTNSFIAHPRFERFKSFLETYLSGKADTSKSSPHDQEEFMGIYLHVIKVQVPEAVIEAGNLEYLDIFWKDFHTELKRFVQDEKELYAREFKP